MAESSRKLKKETVLEKYKILKEIEKVKTCASIVRKHGIAKLNGTPAKWDRFLWSPESHT